MIVSPQEISRLSMNWLSWYFVMLKYICHSAKSKLSNPSSQTQCNILL